MLEGYFH